MLFMNQEKTLFHLEKEIEFVNNFIALQKIRISDQVQIQHEIKGDVPVG